jgi:hypothetical protein
MKGSLKRLKRLLDFFKKFGSKSMSTTNHSNRYIPHKVCMTNFCSELREYILKKREILMSCSYPEYHPVSLSDPTFFELIYDDIYGSMFFFIWGFIYMFPSLFIYVLFFIRYMFLSIIFLSIVFGIVSCIVFFLLYFIFISILCPYKPEFPKFKIV